MRTIPRSITLAAAALSFAAGALPAQSAVTYGVVAGIDFATFTGSDANLSSIGLDKGSLTGFLGGVFVDIPVGTSLAFEPEAIYIGKGTKYSLTDPGFSGDVTFDLEYIEIPALLRYNFKPAGGPYALVGPTVAFNISCSVSGDGDADLPKTDCADIGVIAGVPFDATSVTFGGVVGLGFQRGKIGLEGRYEFDFSEAYKDAGAVKNSAWEILLRYQFK